MAVLRLPAVQRGDQAEALRIQEGHVGEVDHQLARTVLVDLGEPLLEQRRRRGQVDVALRVHPVIVHGLTP